MKQIVIRDVDGVVINIGPWDYSLQPTPIIAVGGEPIYGPVLDPETGTRVMDAETGEPILVKIAEHEPGEKIVADWDRMVPDNPLPEGATEAEEEIVALPDGGLAARDDYRAQRRAAYPPITEQLDALWKGGADAKAMGGKVADVKARYPKTIAAD